MKIYNFDLLAYPDVPEDIPETPVPSSYFDPSVGAQNYREHLEEMAYCEELGFEGVVFNEHHYSAYGTMPSPNLIAAALSQKTKNMKIGILGNILPLRQHPVRVAEEYAMLDCMTDGRLIAGFVRGIPSEYLWYNVRPEESRGRFMEAFDVIMEAWTKPVWSYQGDFFQFENCAIWPRPVQQPHPPIWVAARSSESVEWCTQRKIPIAQVYQTTAQIEDTFAYYRRVAREAGWEADADKFILCRHIHVNETDEKAQAVAEGPLRYFFTLWNRGFNEAKTDVSAEQQKVKAAMVSEKSFNYFREGNQQRVNFHPMGWDELVNSGFLIAGSPDSVAKQINQQMSQIGANHFMGMFHIGNLAHDKVMDSLNLFHKEVMPQLDGV